MRRRLFWPLTLRGTGAVLLAAAAFVAAAVFGLIELVYVGVLLIVTVLFAWISLWFVHRYGDVQRSFSPDVTAVGAESIVTLRSRARSGVPGAVALWRDRLPDGVEGDAAGLLGAVAAQDGMRVTYRLRATRRGIRPVGPFTVTVTDPFGMARRRVRLGEADAVTVTPPVLPLPPLSEFPGEAGGSLHTATHQLGEGADNLIPRPYLPGDSMRRINWRASAHHHELMVRQEEQESTPEATVVLDRADRRWSPSACDEPGADDAFETAVTATVSAAARLAREGYDVTVIDADGTPLAPPVAAGDAAALEQLALELATVVAASVDHLPQLARLFAGTVAGPVVLVTGRVRPVDVEMLTPLVPHSALPVLLVVTGAGGADQTTTDAVTRAEAAGWRAATLRDDGDLADAWRATTDRGTTHATL